MARGSARQKFVHGTGIFFYSRIRLRQQRNRLRCFLCTFNEIRRCKLCQHRQWGENLLHRIGKITKKVGILLLWMPCLTFHRQPRAAFRQAAKKHRAAMKDNFHRLPTGIVLHHVFQSLKAAAFFDPAFQRKLPHRIQKAIGIFFGDWDSVQRHIGTQPNRVIPQIDPHLRSFPPAFQTAPLKACPGEPEPLFQLLSMMYLISSALFSTWMDSA